MVLGPPPSGGSIGNLSPGVSRGVATVFSTDPRVSCLSSSALSCTVSPVLLGAPVALVVRESPGFAKDLASMTLGFLRASHISVGLSGPLAPFVPLRPRSPRAPKSSSSAEAPSRLWPARAPEAPECGSPRSPQSPGPSPSRPKPSLGPALAWPALPCPVRNGPHQARRVPGPPGRNSRDGRPPGSPGPYEPPHYTQTPLPAGQSE